MSTSPTQSRDELDQMIYEALEERDETKLRQAATQVAEYDEEEATKLIKIARKWNDEDQAYDASIGN